MPAGMYMLGSVYPLPVMKKKLDYNHPPKNFKFKNNKQKGKK